MVSNPRTGIFHIVAVAAVLSTASCSTTEPNLEENAPGASAATADAESERDRCRVRTSEGETQSCVAGLLDRAEAYREAGQRQRALGVLGAIREVFELTEDQKRRFIELMDRLQSSTKDDRQQPPTEPNAADTSSGDDENEEGPDSRRALVRKIRDQRPDQAPLFRELQTMLTAADSPEIKKERRQKDWNTDWDPARLRLEHVRESDSDVEMKGWAKSADDVAELLVRLETLETLRDPHLDYVRNLESDATDPFAVGFRLTGKVLESAVNEENTETPTIENPDELLPDHSEVLPLLNRFHEIAESAGVPVESYQRQSEESHSGYATIPLTLEMRGDFAAMTDFLEACETMTPMVRVYDLTLVREAPTDEKFDVSLTVGIYRPELSDED